MEIKATIRNAYPDNIAIPQFCTLHLLASELAPTHRGSVGNLSSLFRLLPSTQTTHLAACAILSFFYFVQIRVRSWFILFLVSSWLQVNYAKQTQFSQSQNHRNLFYHKAL